MLQPETPLSPEPTRPLLLPPELMPLPLDVPLLANSEPLLLMFLLHLFKGTLPSLMLTELLPLPPLLLPPLVLAPSEVSPDLEDSPLDLEPPLLVVHQVSLVPTPVPSEVSEPPPLLSPKERKPRPKPLLIRSVQDTLLLLLSLLDTLSLLKDIELTEVTAPTVAMVLTAATTLTQDSLMPNPPTVAPMEDTVDTVAMVATVDTNKNGDQGSVTF